MRILVVTQYFWPEDFRINELVRELGSRGHDITVLTGVPNYPDGRVFPHFWHDRRRFSSYHGARIIRAPMLARGRGTMRLLLNYLTFALGATLVGLWRLRRDRFDAIFVFEPSPITVGLPAIALRRLKGWPIAFWVLDQWPETLSAVGAVTSPAVLRVVGHLVSFIYARCDVILVQSKSLVSRIQHYCRQPRSVVYFPNWVESAYVTNDAEPAPEVPARADTFDVMFAGNIGESQDFPAILDAADELKDDPSIRWLIVGDGRSAQWVKDEVQRRGLDRQFLMLGRHPIERMPSFFRRADALLVSLRPDPIFAMTIPGKIQSYLVSGVPLIAMLDGEGAAVVDEAGAGMTCAAGDAKALASIVRRVSALTAAERDAMGASGARFARREFDREILLGRLEKWLTAIASLGPEQEKP